jgi:hypothetical protein
MSDAISRAARSLMPAIDETGYTWSADGASDDRAGASKSNGPPQIAQTVASASRRRRASR